MSGSSSQIPPGRELDMMGAESSCSYLPGRTSRMQYRLAISLSAERYEHLLERGWRRFGRTLFRPMCPACSECRSLRIEAARFRPSRSQRRNLSRNTDLTVEIVPASVTTEHLSLYNRYHADMMLRRQWPERSITADEYYESFLDGEFPFSFEFRYRLDGKLVGLGIVDITGRSMSSIYFIHDPQHRDRALGTFSILTELQYAASTGHDWLYMGYYIRDCGSMNYKNRFHPHQLLTAYVDDNAPADWQSV
ncbi:MAG: arginyltransferase [Planctomycetaceae bacterium]